MADEEKNSMGEIDDWLADLNEEEAGPSAEDSGELDQSDIDSLLSGAPEEPAQEAGPGEEAAEEGSLELDQSDIDSLFGEAGEAAPQEAAAAEQPAAGAPEDLAELDQANIDELLSGGEAEATAGGETPQPAPEGEPEQAGEVDLGQADIDDLFGEGGEEEGGGMATAAEEAPSQEEMDELFGEAEEETSVAAPSEPSGEGAETVSFSEITEEGQGGDESFGLDVDEAGLDTETFEFDDSIPDIPDETTVHETPAAEPAAEDIFAEKGSEEELSALLAESGEGGGGKKAKQPFVLPAFVNKTTIGISILSLLLIGGGAFYWLSRDKKEPPAIPVQMQQQQVAEKPLEPTEKEVPIANAAPVVKDEEHRMDEAGDAVALVLTGQDQDGDALEFDITRPPEHGRLSGDLPALTYLPNKNFPGEDSFEYRTFDGHQFSAPATIRITGPDLAKKEVLRAKTLKPQKPVVNAKNVVLKTVSTKPLLIDWKRIWQQANKTPYSSKVSVEIIKKDLRGRLTRISPSRSRYVPDKYFGGNETLSYRFHFDGGKSKVRQLLLRVALGNPPPKIELQPLASAYRVGDTVVLDAGATKDDEPAALAFSWEQVDGVPVRMEALNKEASAVAFVVPSSFYTAKFPQPVILVTATDASGQEDSKEITIETQSRRQTALWRGLKGDGVAHDPACPKGECPGRLLPWPYQD